MQNQGLENWLNFSRGRQELLRREREDSMRAKAATREDRALVAASARADHQAAIDAQLEKEAERTGGQYMGNGALYFGSSAGRADAQRIVDGDQADEYGGDSSPMQDAFRSGKRLGKSGIDAMVKEIEAQAGDEVAKGKGFGSWNELVSARQNTAATHAANLENLRQSRGNTVESAPATREQFLERKRMKADAAEAQRWTNSPERAAWLKAGGENAKPVAPVVANRNAASLAQQTASQKAAAAGRDYADEALETLRPRKEYDMESGRIPLRDSEWRDYGKAMYQRQLNYIKPWYNGGKNANSTANVLTGGFVTGVGAATTAAAAAGLGLGLAGTAGALALPAVAEYHDYKRAQYGRNAVDWEKGIDAKATERNQQALGSAFLTNPQNPYSPLHLSEMYGTKPKKRAAPLAAKTPSKNPYLPYQNYFWSNK